MVVRYQAGPALAPPLADPLGLRLPGLSGLPGMQPKGPVAMPGLGALQRGVPGVPPQAGGLPIGAGIPGLVEQLAAQDPSKLQSLPMLQMQLQNSGMSTFDASIYEQIMLILILCPRHGACYALISCT